MTEQDRIEKLKTFQPRKVYIQWQDMDPEDQEMLKKVGKKNCQVLDTFRDCWLDCQIPFGNTFFNYSIYRIHPDYCYNIMVPDNVGMMWIREGLGLRNGTNTISYHSGTYCIECYLRKNTKCKLVQTPFKDLKKGDIVFPAQLLHTADFTNLYNYKLFMGDHGIGWTCPDSQPDEDGLTSLIYREELDDSRTYYKVVPV